MAEKTAIPQGIVNRVAALQSIADAAPMVGAAASLAATLRTAEPLAERAGIALDIADALAQCETATASMADASTVIAGARAAAGTYREDGATVALAATLGWCWFVLDTADLLDGAATLAEQAVTAASTTRIAPAGKTRRKMTDAGIAAPTAGKVTMTVYNGADVVLVQTVAADRFDSAAHNARKRGIDLARTAKYPGGIFDPHAVKTAMAEGGAIEEGGYRLVVTTA